MPQPREPSWPNAPLHRLSERGTFCFTAATHYHQHFFHTPERLGVLHRGLLQVAREHGWHLEAWAVFVNHYHFIGYCLDDPKSLTAMSRHLHSETAKWLNRLDKTPGRQVWHNFWESRLTNQRSYFARSAYVHRNAVKHGLVDDPVKYPWCSAAWLAQVSSESRVRKIFELPLQRVTMPDDFGPLV